MLTEPILQTPICVNGNLQWRMHGLALHPVIPELEFRNVE